MCDLLLLLESFAQLFPPKTSVAEFPTKPLSKQMSCHFCSLENDIPCFPRLLWASASVISIPPMAAHSDNKDYAGFSGITIVNRLAFIITVTE